jgi:hypothetical protein
MAHEPCLLSGQKSVVSDQRYARRSNNSIETPVIHQQIRSYREAGKLSANLPNVFFAPWDEATRPAAGRTSLTAVILSEYSVAKGVEGPAFSIVLTSRSAVEC